MNVISLIAGMVAIIASLVLTYAYDLRGLGAGLLLIHVLTAAPAPSRKVRS